jgi:hypothetical protein
VAPAGTLTGKTSDLIGHDLQPKNISLGEFEHADPPPFRVLFLEAACSAPLLLGVLVEQAISFSRTRP